MAVVSKRKSRIGKIISDKMQKTVVVSVDTPKRHPLYNRVVKRSVKYKAHDESGQCKMGDTVRIVETRPISKEKRWRVVEVLTKGKVVEVKLEEIGKDLGV